MIAKRRLLWIPVFCAALTGGCATRGPGKENLASQPHVARIYGQVARVNPAEGYVILESTFLPSEGEGITLYRNEQPSGRVRVGSQTEGRFIAADIVEGSPMPGDWFRQD